MTTWDILLPTIPHRHADMCKLLAEIDKQWQPGLQVIIYRDNLELPGNLSYQKWQWLLEKSQADYISYISDDDWVAPDYVERVFEAMTTSPDYVGYAVKYTLNGILQTPVEHSLRHPGWGQKAGLIYRDINHYNPIRRDLALQAMWRSDHFSADATWAADLRSTGNVVTEVYIPEPMYYYRHSSSDAWESPRIPMDTEKIEPLPGYPWLRSV